MKVSIIPWIVKKLKLGLALVEDGDTASQNIASGKYVSWKGSMCQASSAISSGDALSSSNLTAVEGGALNALNGNVTSDTGIQYIRKDGDNSYLAYRKIGKIVSIYMCHKISSSTISSWGTYYFTNANFPYPPKCDMIVRCVGDRASSEGCSFNVNTNGNVYISGRYTGASDTNDVLFASVTYAV